jgi:hypothetical protein
MKTVYFNYSDNQLSQQKFTVISHPSGTARWTPACTSSSSSSSNDHGPTHPGAMLMMKKASS